MPDVAYPGVQVQVVAPAVLVLPVGHAVHEEAPALLEKVLAAQAGRKTTMAIQEGRQDRLNPKMRRCHSTEFHAAHYLCKRATRRSRSQRSRRCMRTWPRFVRFRCWTGTTGTCLPGSR